MLPSRCWEHTGSAFTAQELLSLYLEAVETLAKEWELAPEIVGESAHALIGSIPEIVDQLLVRRERYGLSYITVFEPFMEEFAPVVQELSGQ